MVFPSFCRQRGDPKIDTQMPFGRKEETHKKFFDHENHNKMHSLGSFVSHVPVKPSLQFQGLNWFE